MTTMIKVICPHCSQEDTWIKNKSVINQPATSECEHCGKEFAYHIKQTVTTSVEVSKLNWREIGYIHPPEQGK